MFWMTEQLEKKPDWVVSVSVTITTPWHGFLAGFAAGIIWEIS